MELKMAAQMMPEAIDELNSSAAPESFCCAMETATSHFAIRDHPDPVRPISIHISIEVAADIAFLASKTQRARRHTDR